MPALVERAGESFDAVPRISPVVLLRGIERDEQDRDRLEAVGVFVEGTFGGRHGSSSGSMQRPRRRARVGRSQVQSTTSSLPRTSGKASCSREADRKSVVEGKSAGRREGEQLNGGDG